MTAQIIATLLPVFLIAGCGTLYGRFRTPDIRSLNTLNMEIFVPMLVFAVLADGQAPVCDNPYRRIPLWEGPAGVETLRVHTVDDSEPRFLRLLEMWGEKTGTFTNTERRVQMVNKAIEPLGEARPDWWITSQIAKRIISEGGRHIAEAPYCGWDYEDTSEIMSEINALTPSYGGITHERLANGERLQWPCPAEDHPGTPILHTKGFTRGKGKFMPIDHVPAAETPDDDYPMVLSTGRVLYHWHGGQMTRRAQGLMVVYGEALVELNPDDAERLGINGNKTLRITSRRGSIEAQAWVTDRVPPGMVYANFHFPEASANQLTIAALDPVSKIPEYKVAAVKVELAK